MGAGRGFRGAAGMASQSEFLSSYERRKRLRPKEPGMTKRLWSSEPTNELERLITELASSGPLVFVFGVRWWTAHLVGTTSPTFSGEPDERRWHVEVGDERGKWHRRHGPG